MNKIYGDNLKKLEEYYPFGTQEAIPLSTAQSLYNHMMQLNDNNAQKEIREELLFRTFPMVYNFVVSSPVMYVAYGEFDILDIMQNALELWTQKVDSDILNHIQWYSSFFKVNKFYYQLALKSIDNYRKLSDIIHTRTDNFDVILYEYLKLRLVGKSEEECIEQLFSRFCFSIADASLCSLLEEIFIILSQEIHYFDEDNKFNIRTVELMRHYLVQKVYNRKSRILGVEQTKDEFSLAEEHMIYQSLNEYLKSSSISSYKRELLARYFGLMGSEKQQLNELANLYGVSSTAIRKRIKKILNKFAQSRAFSQKFDFEFQENYSQRKLNKK